MMTLLSCSASDLQHYDFNFESNNTGKWTA